MPSPLRTWVAGVLVAALVGLLALTAAPAPSARADEVDDKLKAMRDFEKDGDAKKAVAMMVQLENSLHDTRVQDEFYKQRTSEVLEVASFAMKKLAGRRHAKLFAWLKTKIDDKKLQKDNDGKSQRYVDVLGAVGMYGDKSTAEPLADVVKKYLTGNPEYTVAAIKAYGSIKEKATIEQLLEWLGQATAGGQSQGGKNESAETKEHKGKARDAILEVLREITGQDIGDADTWNKWWEEHEKTFTFPDPNALKEDDKDPAELTEWTDSAYGFTLQKPEGDGWKFGKKEGATERVRMYLKDPTGLEYARLVWGMHNTSTSNSSTKDAKGLANWWMEETFKKIEFKGFSEPSDSRPKGGAPAVHEEKFAGRDWTVLVAVGDSATGWGGCERRVYFVKMEHLILWCSVVFRTGIEPADKEKLTACVKGIQFKK